jgi:ferric-dicitrate binding protein FerR (iron transport regulator)
MTDMNTERLEELMVKTVDGVATPAEKEELMSHVVDNPELRAELEAQQALKAVTDGWMSRLQADLAADRDRTSPTRRGVRGIGVTLLLVGLAILTAWAPVEMLLDESVPLWVKVGTGLASAGGLLLLFHVIQTRLFGGDNDPYDEVIR